MLRHWPPRSLPELAAQRDVLLAYAEAAPVPVAAGFCGAYVLMQSCAIPGTLFLSLLAGGLYGVWRGSLVVAVVSTLGSCCCYGMSWAVGQPLAHALWPDRLDRYAAEVRRRRSELLNYIIFLRVCGVGLRVRAHVRVRCAAAGRLRKARRRRAAPPRENACPPRFPSCATLQVTPLLPNTFINVASPIVGVPLAPFALGEWAGRVAAGNGGAVIHAGQLMAACGSLLSALHALRPIPPSATPPRHAAGLPAKQPVCGQRGQPPG